MMTTFNNLIEYLQGWEKFWSVADYATPDEKATGILTVGYGFTQINGKPVTAGMKMTEAQALPILTAKVANFRKLMMNLMPDFEEQPQGVQDGIISLAYNMGPRRFPRLVSCVNANNLSGAYEQFFDGIYQSNVPMWGLMRRRACDAQVFLHGTYCDRSFITPSEKQLFLKMNAKNPAAIALINSPRVVVRNMS